MASDPVSLAGESATEVAAGVEEALRAQVNPARREHGQGYFNTSLEILGVAVPDIRRTAKSTARRLRDRPPSDVLSVAEALVEWRRRSPGPYGA